MAKEYIEREKLLQDIEHYHLSDGKFQHWVEIQPAADVAEVRHEWWERVIPTKSAAKWSTKVSCSNCHSVGYTRYNYCPNCGASMDKE